MSDSNNIPSQPQDSGIDFKCTDGSWWGVTLVLEDKDQTLLVKYVGYTSIFDERFKAGNFKNLSEVEEFAARFRRTSKQLEDEECWRMVKGMDISAFHALTKTETRFFDAVIDSVDRTSHEKEQCTCTFHLVWKEGSLSGKRFSAGIQNISLLEPESEDIDPTLTLFLVVCRQKLEVAHDNLQIKFESTPAACALKAIQKSEGATDKAQGFKGNNIHHRGRSKEDKDLEKKSRPTKSLIGTNNLQGISRTPTYLLMIENLEKGLTSSVLVDFISKHVLISSQAQVFPCAQWEIHTKGLIAVATREEFQKLSDFLKNPAQMVLSSRGRPWVITEKQPWLHASSGAFQSLTVPNAVKFESQPWDESTGLSDELELVSQETEKYKKGKLLRELYVEFTSHLEGLYKRLALDQSKILQCSQL